MIGFRFFIFIRIVFSNASIKKLLKNGNISTIL